MEFKLSFGEPKFYVNEEKKTVACKLDCRVNFINGSMPYHAINYIYTSMLDTVPAERMDYGFETIGVSKLDPRDEFDENIGKKVARAKAESKAYEYASQNMYKAFTKFIDELGNAANNFFKKTESVIEHNLRYLEQF